MVHIKQDKTDRNVYFVFEFKVIKNVTSSNIIV